MLNSLNVWNICTYMCVCVCAHACCVHVWYAGYWQQLFWEAVRLQVSTKHRRRAGGVYVSECMCVFVRPGMYVRLCV